MAKSRGHKLEFNIRPVIESMGLAEAIRQIGTDELLEQLDVDDILAHLPRAKREELKRRLLEQDAKRP